TEIIAEDRDPLQHIVPGITSAEILNACNGSNFKDRCGELFEVKLAEFADKHRNDIESAGGQDCRVCEIQFMPVNEKAWTLKGYCSKLCFIKMNPTTSVEVINEPVSNSIKIEEHVIEVTCVEGHLFTVAPMYSGCLRPCPHCQVKTQIP
ncbi:hypothetical protein JYT61_01345, partial [bacterium AH-315-E10]|nr:hypothetical protein [bacterium AH-315-E10]